MIAAPPLELGGDHDTLTVRYADCSAVTAVGAPGEVAGVIASELAGVPVPILLDAVTENVYGTPLVSPEISQVCGPETHEQVRPPGDAVTKYPVMIAPLGTALKLTIAAPSPAVAATDGASGTAAVFNTEVDADGALDPAAFTARTENV